MSSASSEHPSLEVGDRVGDLGWVDHDGNKMFLGQSTHAGRVTVLFVCRSLEAAAVQPDLAAYRRLHGEFRTIDVQVFAVAGGSDAGNAAARLDLPFPVLSDPGFSAARALGLGRGRAAGQHGPSDGLTLIVDPNQRVERRIGQGDGGPQAATALAHCQARAATMEPSVVTAQAPVLIIPNLIDRDHCKQLIRAWETGERYEGGVANSDVGRNVPVQNVKIRGDVALPDLGPEAQELFAVFRGRLFPEIQKAFNFRVTRAETLRLGCYDAKDGGHFRPHRDDTTPFTAHRRFAMSLNLNTGSYEGGGLRFPEYGPQLYSPAAGGAVVFSCSLLREATKVTTGRRFGLFGFFYGEAEQALRQRINAQRQGPGGGGGQLSRPPRPGPISRTVGITQSLAPAALYPGRTASLSAHAASGPHGARRFLGLDHFRNLRNRPAGRDRFDVSPKRSSAACCTNATVWKVWHKCAAVCLTQTAVRGLMHRSFLGF